MSVDYLTPPMSVPLQRPPETINTMPLLHAKCGEIFVTAGWNKWSYHCTLCQLNTSDIGVFICHIRLQHSNDLYNPSEFERSANNSFNINELAANPNSSLIQNDISKDQQPHPLAISRNCNFLIKEVQELANNNQNSSIITTATQETLLPSIMVNNGAICSKVPKIISMETLTEPGGSGDNAGNSKEETSQINDEFLEISSSSEAEDIIEVQYNDNNNTDNHDINDISNFLHCNLGVDADNSDTESAPENNTNTSAVIDITKRVYRRRKPKKSSLSYPHKCSKCTCRFKSKQGVHLHFMKIHGQHFHLNLPYKCNICSKCFKTSSSLSIHKIVHNKDKHYICPLCSETKYREYLFVDHMQTHASNVCFPCYVCGAIYPNDEERMRHWKTHAKDRPYGCEYCFRRYRKHQHLIQHLKAHNKYQCNFCPSSFKADEAKRFPYVCPECEKLPDINEKVQHLINVNNSSPVYDTDVEIL